MKLNSRFVVFLSALLLVSVTQADTTNWWNLNSTALQYWTNFPNWSTTADGSGGAPADINATTGSSTYAVFNATGVNANLSVGLDFGTLVIKGLIFNNTSRTTILATNANRTIFLGAGGITINSGAGTVTFGKTGAGSRVPFNLRASQTWINNSDNLFALNSQNTIALNSYALTIDGTGDMAFTGVVSGTTGSLIKIGDGALTLSANNTFGNGIILNSGTLMLGNNGALGGAASVLTINGGVIDVTATRTTTQAQNWNGEFTFAGSFDWDTGAGAISLGDNRTVTVNDRVMTVGGVIDDGGNTYSLTKAGAGVLTLAGANTYAGGTIVSEGVVSFANTAAVPASGNVTVAAGAGLGLGVGDAGYFSSADVDTLWTNGLSGVSMDPTSLVAIDTTAGDFVYATDQSSRGLIKLGVNTLFLTGSNTYSGGTAVWDGTLNVTNDFALGASGSGLTFNGGALQTSADITLNNRTVTMTGAGTFTPDDGTTLTITNDIIGAGVLYKASTGTLTLSGNASIGGAYVNEGHVNLSGNLGASGNIIVGRLSNVVATASIQGGSVTCTTFYAGNLGGTTGIVYQTGGDVTSSSSLQVGGAAGSYGEYHLYDGTLNAGANLYIGVNRDTVGLFEMTNGTMTAVNLIVARNNTSGATNITAYYYQSGGTATVTTLHLGGSGSNARQNFGLLAISNGVFTANNFSGLAAGPNCTGVVYIGQGAVVTLGAFPTTRGAGSYSEITFDGGQLSPYAASANYMSNLDHAYITANGAILNVASGNDITIAQNLEDAPSDTGKLIKTGAGVLTLAGNNTYTGGTFVNEGVLSVLNTSALAQYNVAGQVNVTNNTVIAFGIGAGEWSHDQIRDAVTNATLGSGVLVGFDTTSGGATISDSLSNGFYSADITGYAKIGANTLILSGNNTYTGPTWLFAGTLQADNENALGNGGAISFFGGTLQYTANSTNTDWAARFQNSASAVSLDTADLTVSLAGVIDNSNTGGLDKLGAGTLTFTSAQNFEGGLTVTYGFLQLASVDNPISTNNSITITSNGTLDLGGGTQTTTNVVSFLGGLTQNGTLNSLNFDYDGRNGTVAANLTGPVGLNKTTGSRLTLTGINTYSGATVLNAGTLTVDSLADTGGPVPTNGPLVFNGGALQYTGAGDTTARIITNAGNATFDITNRLATLTVNSSITGEGGLTKRGAGNLTFGTAQSFEGDLTVLGGFVQLASGDNPISTNAAITVNSSSATLDLGGGTQTTTNLVSLRSGITQNGILNSLVYDYDVRAGTNRANLTGPVGLIKTTTGTHLMLATNDYTGITSIEAGVLRAGARSTDIFSLGSGNININGGVLEFFIMTDGDVTFNRTLGTGDGQVQVIGDASGFSASHGYTGGTSTRAGRIRLNNSAAYTVEWGSEAFNPEVLVLQSAGATRLLYFENNLDLNGADRAINVLSVNNSTITFAIISGNITDSTGAASLIKGGRGLLQLDGVNTYSGSTIVTGGILRIGNATLTSLALPDGNLVLSNGVIEINYGLAYSEFTRSLGTGTNQVYIAPGTVSGFSSYGAPSTYNLGGDGHMLTWGSAEFDPAALVLNAASANAVLRFVNDIDLNGADRQINVDAATAPARISGIITNTSGTTAGLIKSGAGTLRVVGDNFRYDGPTIIAGGELQLGDYRFENGVLPGAISNMAYVYFANRHAQTVTNTLSGTGTFTMQGNADVTFIGSNSAFQGTINIYNGALYLDHSHPLAPVSDIGGLDSALFLQGGTLTVIGSSDGNVTNSQIFSGWRLNTGWSRIIVVGSAGAFVDLTIGDVVRIATNSGVVDFTMTNGSISGSAANFGIIGGFATIDKADWATVNGNVITNFTGYTAPTAGVIQNDNSTHVRISGDASITANTAINTLSGTNDGGSATVSLNGNTLRLGAYGGLLNPTGAGALTIGASPNDGILTAGTNINNIGELILLNYSDSLLTINSSLTDNGSGALAVTIAGGQVRLNGDHSFTGAFRLIGGAEVTLSEGSSVLLQRGPLTLLRASLVVSGELFSSSASEYIGWTYGDVATLTLAGSGVYQRTNAAGGFYLGNQIASMGVLTIQDDALYSNRYRTYIGNNGSGIVYQTGGTYYNRDNTYLGNAGRGYTPGPGAIGRYFLYGGNFTNVGILYVGNQGHGAFHQFNGTAFVQGEMQLASGYGGYGYYELSGGSLENAGTVRVGIQGTGIFYLLGGSENITSGNGMRVGEGIGGASVVYASGGALTNAGPIYLGYSVGATRSEFTVAGDASIVLVDRMLQMNRTADCITTNILNLNGGLLQLNAITRGDAGGMSIVNFNGGTLQANTGTTTFLEGMDGAYVYSGGAVINDGGNSITISQALLAPTGSGVTNIPWSGDIDGYMGAPYVAIEGGSGTGATAVALFDHVSGSVTGIIITSYGFGYDPGDTVTVTLMEGGNTNYLIGAAQIGDNTDTGGLAKFGAGTLLLYGSNTYGGATVVNEGMLGLLYKLPNPNGLTVSNGAGLILGVGTPGQWSADDVTNIITTLISPTGTFGLDTSLGNFTYGLGLGGFSNFYKFGPNTLILSGASAYNGNAYVMGGALQAEWGAGLPNTANLILTGGVWETTTGIASNWGTGPGQFQLPGSAGGFSAANNPLIVNIGGNGDAVVWGGTAAFNPDVLVLQALSADADLTFVNPLDLNGVARTVSVESANMPATMIGNIYSASGDAGLTKTGVGTLVFSNNTADLSGLTVGEGNLILHNATVSNNNSSMIVGNLSGSVGTLTLQGSTIVSNTAQLLIGSGNGAQGVLIMENDASLGVTNYVRVGYGGTGVVHMTGGTLTMPALDIRVGENSTGFGIIYQTGGAIVGVRNTADIFLGYTAGAYGFYQMATGTYTSAGWTYVGNAGMGILYQSGGYWTNNTSSRGLLLSSSVSSTGVLYQTGGTMILRELRLVNAHGGLAEVNIADGGLVDVTTSLNYYRSGTGIVNLVGGTLEINSISGASETGPTNLTLLNFDGGTLRAGANFTMAADTITAVYLHSGGATIDVQGYTVEFGQALVAPTGHGVTNIDFSGSPLTDYLGAPYVGIAGGTGTGATAVALFDYTTGSVTGILITSRGSGYQPGDIVTATLVGGGSSNVTFSAVLGANVGGGLTKLGVGTLFLSGTNTYTGGTTINEGILTALNTGALPEYNVAGKLTVASNAVIGVRIGGAGEWDGNQITDMITNANMAAGALLGFDTTSGNVTIPDNLTDTSVAIGYGKLGANTLTLTGSNTYSGATRIEGGQLLLVGEPAVSPNSTYEINTANTVLFSNITTATMGGLAGGSSGTLGMTNIGTGAAIALSVGANNEDTTFGGKLSGAGASLIKVGNGTLTLSSTNTHTGATVIEAGTLRLTPSTLMTNTVRFEVFNDAILDVTSIFTFDLQPHQELKGSGTVHGNVMAGAGSITPGHSIGTLTITGDLYLYDGVQLNFELNTPSNSDRIIVSNSLNFAEMATNWFVFSAADGVELGNYVLFHSEWGYAYSYLLDGGTNFDNVANSGNHGYLWLNENGQDVMLTVVPEPNAGTLAGFGLLMLLALRHWRRR